MASRSGSQGPPRPPHHLSNVLFPQTQPGDSELIIIPFLLNQPTLRTSVPTKVPRHPSLTPQYHLWFSPLLSLNPLNCPLQYKLPLFASLTSVFSPCQSGTHNLRLICVCLFPLLAVFGFLVLFPTASHWESESSWQLNSPQTHSICPFPLAEDCAVRPLYTPFHIYTGCYPAHWGYSLDTTSSMKFCLISPTKHGIFSFETHDLHCCCCFSRLSSNIICCLPKQWTSHAIPH